MTQKMLDAIFTAIGCGLLSGLSLMAKRDLRAELKAERKLCSAFSIAFIILAVIIVLSGCSANKSTEPDDEFNYEDIPCLTITASRKVSPSYNLYENVELRLWSTELDSMDYGDESEPFYNQCPDAQTLSLNLNDSLLIINGCKVVNLKGSIAIHAHLTDGTQL